MCRSLTLGLPLAVGITVHGRTGPLVNQRVGHADPAGVADVLVLSSMGGKRLITLRDGAGKANAGTLIREEADTVAASHTRRS